MHVHALLMRFLPVLRDRLILEGLVNDLWNDLGTMSFVR